jgi:hypothetical protein
MNGRVYDYNLGRFLSVDPFIQAPGNSQSMNPYSYIMNNPLSGTDPSGYTAECEVEASCANVKVETGDKIIQDKDGNKYLDKGGDTVVKIETVSATSNGLKTSIGVGARNLGNVSIETTESASENANNDQGWIDSAVNEVSSFGNWLTNHANEDIGSQSGWQGDVWSFFAEDSINAFNQVTEGKLDEALVSMAMAFAKPLKAADNAIDSYNNLRKAGLKDAHHIIQDAAVRDVPGYKRGSAPSIQLPGPASRQGTPHYFATQAQRQRGGGTYGAERRIGYKALRKAGISKADARSAISAADEYFKSLGVKSSTKLRIPGNR